MKTLSEVQFNQHLGQMVRMRRRKMGLTQKDVATRIGVTFQQFQKYETGQSAMSVFRLHQISDVLGLETASLSKQGA